MVGGFLVINIFIYKKMKDLNKLIKENIHKYILLKENQEKTLNELLGVITIWLD